MNDCIQLLTKILKTLLKTDACSCLFIYYLLISMVSKILPSNSKKYFIYIQYVFNFQSIKSSMDFYEIFTGLKMLA